MPGRIHPERAASQDPETVAKLERLAGYWEQVQAGHGYWWPASTRANFRALATWAAQPVVSEDRLRALTRYRLAFGRPIGSATGTRWAGWADWVERVKPHWTAEQKRRFLAVLNR